MINMLLPFLSALIFTLINLKMTYHCTVEEIRKGNKYTVVFILIAIIIALILREVRS